MRRPTLPDGTINLSDPDSRVMRSKGLPHRQAYNVQTAVTEQQIILAAEISLDAPDFGHLEPMLDQALAHLRRHGITEQPEAVVGDAGYWHTRQIEAIADRGIEVLVPPDGAAREGKRPGWEDGVYEQMREKLQTDRGRALYALRKITIEPSSGRSNTTGVSISSCEEAEPPCSQSCGWWQRPTTCSSSTTTGSPTPPEKGQGSRSSRGDMFASHAENGTPLFPHFPTAWWQSTRQIAASDGRARVLCLRCASRENEPPDRHRRRRRRCGRSLRDRVVSEWFMEPLAGGVRDDECVRGREVAAVPSEGCSKLC